MTELKENEEDTICPVCMLVYPGALDWIGCDGCHTWLDRNCAGLAVELEWQKCSKQDKWYCRKCTSEHKNE
jgi:hypothetical protein